MIEIANVRLPLDAGLAGGEAIMRAIAAQAIGVDAAEVEALELVKRSVDARKGDVHFVATVAVSLSSKELEKRVLDEATRAKVLEPNLQGRSGKASRARRKKGKDGKGAAGNVAHPKKSGIVVKEHVAYKPLVIPQAFALEGEPRPVVVGSGPAGLFAAVYLAEAGMKPLVLERGGDVSERMNAVDAFNSGAPLDFATNIQFGEGGAGTFSDGKLTTGTKSPLARHVLQWFVDAGAPEEILWQAKPHIGTDKLVDVVRNLRKRIEAAGGEVLFHAKLADIAFDELSRLKEITVERTEGKETRVEHIPAKMLVLACGHSARDTFRMLQRANIAMEPKAFSVGVRIEHRREDIDRAQYGDAAGHPALGAADYKMVVHLPSGRSVYTFCMCPGGEVVCAASEDYGVVVNGMSRFNRDAENSNAALLVNVDPSDFPSKDPLAGTRFQRLIEQAAFGEARELGGDAWTAPAQTVGDFLADTAGNPSQTVTPSYARGVVWCDLREILPEFVTDSLAQALPQLDRKLAGFADEGAVMTGVETRSSSPVRILRDETTLMAYIRTPRKKVRARDIARGHGTVPPEIPDRPAHGVFPCGEGPGYAGGIMSAAVDGLRVAQELVLINNLSAALSGAMKVFDDEDASGQDVQDLQRLDSTRKDENAFAAAVHALAQGKAAIFPTDTVYGLGVSVAHAASPQAIYDVKQRDAGKPIAWLVPGVDALDEYGDDVTEEARALAKTHWPGALTIIVKASDRVPEAYRSAEGTIGLRMPANETALELMRCLGSPLATSSANVSGGPDPRTADELDSDLVKRVGALVTDEAPTSGVSSTVVDCTQGSIRVIRQGEVSV